MTKRGRFITIEGGEGAGKSTQAALLADALRGRGLKATVTREPGGSPAAEAIRTLILDRAAVEMDPMGQALLHFAARRDHILARLRPALESGNWVICDRFTDSTIAYQGYGLGADLADLAALNEIATGGFMPDLTLILALPAKVGLTRIRRRGGAPDGYERRDLDFHERVNQGFLAIAESDPQRCKVIDGTGAVETIAERLSQVVFDRFARECPP